MKHTTYVLALSVAAFSIWACSERHQIAPANAHKAIDVQHSKSDFTFKMEEVDKASFDRSFELVKNGR